MGDPAIIEHHPECSEGNITLGQLGVLSSNFKWRFMKEEFQTAKRDNNNQNNNKNSDSNNDRDNKSNDN